MKKLEKMGPSISMPNRSKIIRSVFEEHPSFSNKDIINHIEKFYSIRVRSNLIINVLGSNSLRKNYVDRLKTIGQLAKDLMKSCQFDRRLAILALKGF